MSPNPALLTVPHRVGGPSPVSGASAWWKADALSLADGDPVATWADSSGGGYDATQSTSGYRPVYKTAIKNGLPVVRFAGTYPAAQHMTTTASASTAAVTITMALYLSSFYNGYSTPVGSTGTGAWQVDMSNTDGFRLLRQYAAVLKATGSGTTPLGAWYILTARYGGSATKLRINSTDYTATVTYAPTAGRSFILGRNDGGAGPSSGATGANNFFFGGDLAEVLVYSSALSDSDLSANHAYLTAKWGL